MQGVFIENTAVTTTARHQPLRIVDEIERSKDGFARERMTGKK